MQLKKITTSTLLAIVLIICSLTTISAADQTINDTSTGGILQGITDTGTGDTLYLNPGTYNKTNQDTNININKNITIQGNGPKDQVIIDAQGLNRIFTISNNRNIIFINITFLNGRSNYGAAISISNSNNTLLTLINCLFINNSAPSSYGGGIYCEYANLVIIDSTFINNTAKYGSAIRAYGTHNSSIINSTFISNYIPLGSSGGGTISIQATNNFNISDSVFINNSGDSWGGGITATIVNNLTINNCNFINNSATYGGAIQLDRTNNTFINNCEFFDNNASYGGGIYAENGNNLTIISSNFTNNSGNNGGAIYNHGNSDSANIENNTIVGNNGTGITNKGNNTTISGNNITNNNGNGITNTGNVTLIGNDLRNNNGSALVNNGTINSNNNIISNTRLTITTSVSSNKVSIRVKAIDDSDNVIVGQYINFYINGKLIGTAITDSNGIAELVYNASSSGNFDLLATIDNFNITDSLGTNIYYGSNTTDSFNIAPIYPFIDPINPIGPIDPKILKTPKNPDSPKLNNNTNKTSNNPAVKTTASMKKTGTTINMIILVLLSCLGIVIRKK